MTAVNGNPADAIVLAASSILLCFATWSFITSTRKPPYPPGPSQLPLIGNIHNFPKRDIPQAFDEWKEVYGMSSFSVQQGVLQRISRA
jgi:hypothetical protein